MNQEKNSEVTADVTPDVLEVVEPIQIVQAPEVDLQLINDTMELIQWWGYWGIPLILIVVFFWTIFKEFLYTKL